MIKSTHAAVLLVALLTATPTFSQGISDAPPDPARVDADLNRALENRVDTAKKSVGIVVGILTPDGRRYLSRGLTATQGGTAPGPQTMFEIGSMTKVFTALLLADMVERGEVGLDDPISKWLPKGTEVPSYEGKPITLIDLATHSSGLPRLPDNIDATNLVDPYALYGPAQLYGFLASYKLTRAPGSQWEYSNLGAGLLGYILSLRAGVSYEQLLRARILEPLGMSSTTITLSAEQCSRMATGYDLSGRVTGMWHWDALAAAGAIRSDASDLLTFAAAVLGYSKHPLEAAVKRMLSVSRPAGSPAMLQQLGLLLLGGNVLFHDGGTGGYRSALAIRPATRQAVVVLSNSTQDLTDIALHAVVPEQPLVVFSAYREHSVILPDEKLLDTYAGTYRMTPQIALVVTHEGARLFAQATGQPKTEWFADRDGTFFDKQLASDDNFRFVKDASGRVTQLRMQIGGAVIQAARE
jgi:D-alanyl-D-alanine-carboxypeptidase/D-alanyl-D-alanine-endopeptidase